MRCRQYFRIRRVHFTNIIKNTITNLPSHDVNRMGLNDAKSYGVMVLGTCRKIDNSTLDRAFYMIHIFTIHYTRLYDYCFISIGRGCNVYVAADVPAT